MLVLSRRKDETVVIGDEIHVTVLEVRGNSVKLGFKAPAEVAIRRSELPIARTHDAALVVTGAPADPMFVVEATIG